MIKLANRQKAALIKAQALELERLTIAFYSTVYEATEADRDALLRLLEEEELTERKVRESKAFKRLLSNTSSALAAFSAFMLVELASVNRANIERGSKDAIDQILRGGTLLNMKLKPNSIPLEALIQMQKLLDPAGPLIERINAYSSVHSEAIAQGLIDAVRKGWNPIRTAKEFKRLYGFPLSDALRLTRTAQIYSYRRASHSNYRANEEVVHGWIWWAKLDSRTCLSCIENHGKFFPNDEELNDHYNGRCTAIPSIFGYNPTDETGEEWFRNLSKAEQLKIMGKGKHSAWEEGKIDFGQFSVPKPDPVYGEMRNEASLKSLIEDE